MLLAAPLGAQEPADTVPSRVPLPAAPKDSVRPDTVKSPLAVAPRPGSPEIAGRRTVWDRDAIFASGSLTLPELLAQIPGVTVYNAGFIAAPTATSWYGEPGRVRVFLDGVEMDALDPREGGVRDLAVIQLWTLEEVAVERGAGELRVFLRSWRVRLTTAETRTDITTGSENTNLYRGFFGKRMESGGVVQVAAQQYSTTSVRSAGDGDALAAFGRIGFARGRLTVDGVATRFKRTRSATIRNVLSGAPDPLAIGAFEGNDASGYLRAAWGDADGEGLWAQAIAASLRHEEAGDSTVGADTARSESQYVGSVGFTRWGARLSATGRLRVREGVSRFAPSYRAELARGWFAASAFAESGGPDSTRRMDAILTVTPFPWLQLLGAHAVATPEDEIAGGPPRTTSRVEAGVRVYDRWVTAGMIRRSSSQLLGMPVFDPEFGPTTLSESTGIEGGVRGRLRGSFSFEWRGVQWSGDELYRPSVESHAEIRFSSAFLRQIKRNTFNLTAAVTHDYRGALRAPAGAGSVVVAEGAGVYGTLVEMRIGSAHIFWYNRNSNANIYETVPGYLMPRIVQLYGVRWDFWN